MVHGGDNLERQSDAPEVRAFTTWNAVHDRDVNEAPFWREYATLTTAIDRLTYLLAYAKRPNEYDTPTCPRSGRTMTGDRQRSLLMVAYLRGDFGAPDLPPVKSPWDWPRIARLALEMGDGWDSWTDVKRSAGRYADAVEKGGLQIVCQPESARAILDLSARDDSVQEIGGFLGTTPAG